LTFYQPQRIALEEQEPNDSGLINEQRENVEPRYFWRFCVLVYVVTLFCPIYFQVGAIRLSPTKIVLALLLVPAMLQTFANARRPFVVPDLMVLLYCLWAGICFAVVHGAGDAIEPAGSLFIELTGSYFLARIAIQSPSDFRFFFKLLFFAVLLLLPFSVLESLSGERTLLSLFGRFFSVYTPVAPELRAGLFRSQGPFEHPILFGVVASIALGSAFVQFSGADGLFKRMLRAFIVTSVVFTTLSVGAFLSIVVQVILKLWDLVFGQFKSRWTVLFVGFAFLYIAVDLLSNRTPPEVFISYLTFRTDASYNRLNIWQFGTQSVWNNPIFGIGFNEWERPYWMGLSVDNFWLLRAMRFGIPGLLILVVGFFFAVRSAASVKLQSEQQESCRRAFLIVICAIAVSITTVDLWSNSQALFFFLIGSGAWLVGTSGGSAMEKVA
jgi:hypothetical protein